MYHVALDLDQGQVKQVKLAATTAGKTVKDYLTAVVVAAIKRVEVLKTKGGIGKK